MHATKLNLLVAFGAAVCLMTGITAKADIFNVGAGDVAGLISAINAANANGQGDVINLAAGGTYDVTSADSTNYGENAFPTIASTIFIKGDGATIQIPSETATTRFFYVAPSGDLTLWNLTLAGGSSQGGTGGVGGGGGGAGMGGGIYSGGTVGV